MASRRGTLIENVEAGSPAAAAGIKPGDLLVSINGRPINDFIDYMFYRNDPEPELVIARGGRKFSVMLESDEETDPGLELAHFKIRTCKNKCIFCFVSQLPKGLRRTLYVRDEDYRMSFLYGNYVTLTGLTAEDRKRIVTQRLSPLYISVHSTDKAIRNKILGNAKAPDIMKELRFFRRNKIRMHTQIVLCPRMNDGNALKKTIRDLHWLYPYVASIAVVPVGITEHGKEKLVPVSKKDAEDALSTVEAFQRRFDKAHGERLVYASDELYIRAERPFPPLENFGELPQIENGVGMVPDFISKARRLKIDLKPVKYRFITFTGVSFFPFLKKFTDRLSKRGIDIVPISIENSFFGATVTVAGLLTGRDVIKSIAGLKRKRDDILLVPDVTLKNNEFFLDDVSVKEIEAALDLRARVIESTPEGLLKGIRNGN